MLGPLPVELGYPCYFPSIATLADATIFTVGSGIRAYVSLVATARVSLRVLLRRKEGPDVAVQFSLRWVF